MEKIKLRIEHLRKEIKKYQDLYYKESKSNISDVEFDKLFDELIKLENLYPEYKDENSPSFQVGSDLNENFIEREHLIPVLSLNKVYSTTEMISWMKKFSNKSSFTIEEKLDGVSVVLYYNKGILLYALSRGDGTKGNDITANIKKIKSIPHKISSLDFLAFRGEVYIEKEDFLYLNQDNRFSNPRNLASGTLRNINPQNINIPLKIKIFDCFFISGGLNNNIKEQALIRNLKLPAGKEIIIISDKEEKELINYPYKNKVYRIEELNNIIEEYTNKRDRLRHEIDGMVIKINNNSLRKELGYTGHHPKWAMAYKFESPKGQSLLKDIHIQIGRNGKVTPVATIEPVSIAGSIITRATLHNQEYIDSLCISINDTVEISKRGDVIPAVEKVIKSSKGNRYKIPDNCPFCRTRLIKDGAHHFCKNNDCKERQRRTLLFFASRGQMDISGLGEKTINIMIENNFINSIADIYKFDYKKLIEINGFKEKKINNIIKSVNKSKKQPFNIVLSSLGLESIGKELAKKLIKEGYNSINKIVDEVNQNEHEPFINLKGIAKNLSDTLKNNFQDKKTLLTIEELQKIGLNFEEEILQKESDIFKNQLWVITGSFKNFKPRSKAKTIIENNGGKVSLEVSSNTTHLLVGKNPGSKLSKAREKKILLVNEEEFLRLFQ